MFWRFSILLVFCFALPLPAQVEIKAAQADGVINAIGEATIAFPGPTSSFTSKPSTFAIHTEALGSPVGCEYEIQGCWMDVNSNGLVRSGSGSGSAPPASCWVKLAPLTDVLSCQPGQDNRDHVVGNRPYPAIRVVLTAGTGLTDLKVRYSRTD